MTMDDRDGFIWQDGVWVDWRDAKVHVLTHTLHYGLGVFEGVRAYHAEKAQRFSVCKNTRTDYFVRRTS